MSVNFSPFVSDVRSDLENENPYLCECGTFLNLRTRIKQLNDSGRVMFEAKKAFARSQCLDSRMLDNDESFDSEYDDFDAIDANKAVDKFTESEKVNAEKRDLNANTSVKTDSDSKTINDSEKSSENASKSVSDANS